ncbi:MAG: glycosyltransferase family 2 protein [Candidatus Helarchaeales archaeon]
MTSKEVPFVSIIVPVRNEKEHIRECLEALLNQDYPADRYEIIIAEGMSEDGTRSIIQQLMNDHPGRMRMLDNPKKLASPGLDMGILEAKSDILGLIGGHTIAPPNWISVLSEILLSSGEEVAAVGSTTLTANETPVTKAQELALNSAFGGFKMAESKQITREGVSDIYEVDSVSFAFYRRPVLLEVGMHDEKLFSGDDFEMNYRIRKKGYKILATTRVKVRFYRRTTVKKFYKRMYEFGQARALITKKHKDSFRIYYLVPPLFTIFLFGVGVFNLFTLILNYFFQVHLFGALSIFNLPLDVVIQWLYVAVLGLYIFLALLFTIKSWKKFKHKRGLIYLFIMYPMIHVGFGLGFIRGLFPYRKIKPQR